MITKVRQYFRRRRLAKALVSGEYDQGTGGLRFNEAFCCLGVACDLYHRETRLGQWDQLSNFGDHRFSPPGDFGHNIYLPTKVQAYFGFATKVGTMKDGESLMELNDEGVSFSEIADLIRKGAVKVS